jgi:hypothetical protein
MLASNSWAARKTCALCKTPCLYASDGISAISTALWRATIALEKAPASRHRLCHHVVSISQRTNPDMDLSKWPTLRILSHSLRCAPYHCHLRVANHPHRFRSHHRGHVRRRCRSHHCSCDHEERLDLPLGSSSLACRSVSHVSHPQRFKAVETDGWRLNWPTTSQKRICEHSFAEKKSSFVPTQLGDGFLCFNSAWRRCSTCSCFCDGGDSTRYQPPTCHSALSSTRHQLERL